MDRSCGEGFKKIRYKINFGLKKKVLNGESTLFWEDVWLGEIPLRLEFPKLFQYCTKQGATISDFWAEGEWNIPFRRSFGAEEIADWEMLMEKLQGVNPQRGKDIPIWSFENSGQYTSKSMYRFLTYRGVVNRRMEKLWHTKRTNPKTQNLHVGGDTREVADWGCSKTKKWKGD